MRFSPQPSSLRNARGSESTNLLGTVHSPAPQWLLDEAHMSLEDMGGQWLSGSQRDRSGPGGTSEGLELWAAAGSVLLLAEAHPERSLPAPPSRGTVLCRVSGHVDGGLAGSAIDCALPRLLLGVGIVCMRNHC